jgi:RimJ/RimL family protein N-acetyltransferase
MADRIEQHFCEHGFGLWAIEVPGGAPFIGFAGLSWARFSAPFTPCVEVGWRLACEHWGYGYATEAARLALGYGFGPLALSEIVSFTSATNHRSRAVMKRLGMRRDPAEDFDYPGLPENHPLRRHVLYRLGSDSYAGTCRLPQTVEMNRASDGALGICTPCSCGKLQPLWRLGTPKNV